MVVKDGRYGPYVTDGEVNASLGKGDSVEALTVERAAELLQVRRDKVAAGGRQTCGSSQVHGQEEDRGEDRHGQEEDCGKIRGGQVGGGKEKAVASVGIVGQ